MSRVRDQLARLPQGISQVAGGLVLTGATAYVFLILTARLLGPSKYALISSLWSLVFILGLGLFLPLQQELSRQISIRNIAIMGYREVVIAVMKFVAMLLVLVLGATWLFRSKLEHYFFGRNSELLVALGIALVGYAMLSVVLGVLAGRREFRLYAFAQSLDGLLRVIATVLVAAVGVRYVGTYALIFAVMPAAASVLIYFHLRRVLVDGGPSSVLDIAKSIGWLLVGSLCSQLLLNGVVLIAKAHSNASNSRAIGGFIAATVLVRVPLFMFGALQSTLLPKLSSLAGLRKFHELRSSVIHSTRFVVTICIPGLVAAFFAGPAILRVLFSSKFNVNSVNITLLMLGVAVFMLAMLPTQGLIALSKQAKSSVGWIASVPAFLLCLGLHMQLFQKIEVGLIVGSGSAYVVSYFLFHRSITVEMRS